jgi:unsaturated chondroitin disaccharide hydrolase
LAPILKDALDFAARQADQVVTRYPDYHPMYTVGGHWHHEGEKWTHWCEGFYPGIFWLLYEYTGQQLWRDRAEEYSLRLAPRRYDREVHDLGFLFFSTYFRWYRLTKESNLRDVLIDAGRTLALRREKGGYLKSFIGPQSLFIDIMMNVGIIFWAARESNDPTLRAIALEHCRTTAKYLIRKDGSTVHEGIFDLDSGAFLREGTHQGWNQQSAWSRGQAWAIYGFTAAHRLSGEPEFLDTALKCAEFYLRSAGPGLVPPWDFSLPAEAPFLWDSSAAAITACGFLDIAALVTEPEHKRRFQEASFTILRTLCSDAFLARSQPGWEGILLHGVYHFHKNLGVDESVAWGDHFFVEALVKAWKVVDRGS